MLHLSSFRHSVDYRLELEGAGLPPLFSLTVVGEFVAPDLVSCRHEASFLGVTLAFPRLVVFGDSAWLDVGEGWRAALLSEPEVAEALGVCAGYASFWEAVPLSVGPGALPEEVDRNGVPSLRYDLFEGLDPGEFFPDYASLVEDLSASLWVAAAGGWPVALVVEGVTPEALDDWPVAVDGGGQGSPGAPPVGGEVMLRLRLSVEITGVDDPDITVVPPEAGPLRPGSGLPGRRGEGRVWP